MKRSLLFVLSAVFLLTAFVAGAVAAFGSTTWGPNSPGYIDPVKFIKANSITPL